MTSLDEAQRARRLKLGIEREVAVETKVEMAADILLANYQRVTPKEKKQLHGLLKYYANKKHPFEACVRDNTKRFGKDRAERICAVLKDIIRGTTKWRGKNNPRDVGRTKWAMSEVNMADVDMQAPVVSNRVANLILNLDDERMDRLCQILSSDDD